MARPSKFAHIVYVAKAPRPAPIGVPFDPDELAKQFRAGVPEARLLARPDGPPAPIPREHGLGTAA